MLGSSKPLEDKAEGDSVTPELLSPLFGSLAPPCDYPRVVSSCPVLDSRWFVNYDSNRYQLLFSIWVCFQGTKGNANVRENSEGTQKL